MVVTLNTNQSAMIALQNLALSNSQLDKVQKRISTGLNVSDALDNAGVFAVAQRMRADVKAYDAVSQSVSRGTNIVNVALAAAEGISNLLIEMKNKAVAAADPSLTNANRILYDQDYQALKSQMLTMIDSATFDGFNLIDKSPPVPATDDLQVLTEPTANPANAINIAALDVKSVTTATLGGLTSLTNSQAEVTAINTALDAVSGNLATLGGAAAKLDAHSVFIVKLQDALNTGIGNLVDADLGRESARLQSLQIKQQLSTQALSIANQRPQQILALFRR